MDEKLGMNKKTRLDEVKKFSPPDHVAQKMTR